MRLGDVLRDAGLAGLGELALLLFVGLFAAIVWRTFSGRRREEQDRASRLPLEE